SRVAVGELIPGGRPSLDHRAVERGVRALDRERADVLPVATGVAVERAADRAGDPRGELETRERTVATLVDELQEVDAGADVRRRVVELHLLDRVSDHQAAKALVRDQ